MDEIKTIKDYNKKPTELWQDVKEYLSQYYWYLRTEKENEFFNKINELRLYILICSVWYELTFRDDGRRFCKVVSEITNL